jgi:hypothetical protein
MIRALRRQLTYANVMATLAVFVALGGASYAALRITSRNVPKNALTGADIKGLTGKDVRKDSLTGADIRGIGTADVTDGGLLAADFAAGQLPAGAAGPKGDQGDRGPTGPAGPTAGTTGGDYEDPRADPTAVLEQAEIILPTAGRIYVQASVRSALGSCTFSGTPQLSGNCNMYIGLYVDGQPVPRSSFSLGNSSASNATSFTTNLNHQGSDRSLFGLTDELPAGVHTVQLSAKIDPVPNNANTTGAVGPNGPSANAIVGGIALGG